MNSYITLSFLVLVHKLSRTTGIHKQRLQRVNGGFTYLYETCLKMY